MLKKIALASLVAIASLSAQAAEVSVSKLRINMEGAQTADFLTLLNQAESKKESFEVKLYKWSQKDAVKGDDGKYAGPQEVLEESGAVLVSPKTLVVLPKQDKVVRIILNNAAEAKKDYSYRMIINQLPSKEPNAGEQNVVNLLFKISLPIFVYNDKIKKVQEMSLERNLVKEEGKNVLVLKNNDNQHIQIQNIVYNKDTKFSVNHYILPGITDKISLPEELSADMFKAGVTLETDKGNLEIK